MPGLEIHGKDCIELLGKPFDHVHRFLDVYAADFPPPVFYDYHRSLLHNSYGLAIVKARWGKEAYEAARFHLARDYDDSCSIGKLPSRVDVAVVWFNNLENMELHFMPRYLNCREEGLMAMLDWDIKKGD